VAFLISWGANIDHQDNDHAQTALHLASQQGHIRIVRKLLIKGADRNLKDKENKLPLDYAIERRYKTIEILLRNEIGLPEKCGLR
jgi:palmitoyltransferase